MWRGFSPLLRAVLSARSCEQFCQPALASSFDCWLRRATLEKGQPILLPVRLAADHRQALAGKPRNPSTVLARKAEGWWLTRTDDEPVRVETPKDAPVSGSAVGLATFSTVSTGQQYGSFNGTLAKRHKRDREKRRRKAKLRACLKQQGVKRLPSTRNKQLARQVRQASNRAVNALDHDHPAAPFAEEHLNVAGMQFQARRMNAYRYASNRAHIPAQLAWGAAKTRHPCPSSHECLELASVSSVSPCRPPEPAQPTDVLLWGLRAHRAGRRERGSASGKSLQCSRACCRYRPQGQQSALGKTAPGLARQTTVGRRPTARPVVSSTGAGARVKYLMILCSTISYG
jgi:hypothetical protein